MDQRKIRGLVHKRGDEGQPGCWTWGGALSLQEPLGSAEGEQEIEEAKMGLLGRKGKTGGRRVLVEGGWASKLWRARPLPREAA